MVGPYSQSLSCRPRGARAREIEEGRIKEVLPTWETGRAEVGCARDVGEKDHGNVIIYSIKEEQTT